MTEAVKTVTFLNTVFVILLVLSGNFSGIVGELVYYLAFLVPVMIGFYSSKGLKYKREEEKGIAEAPDRLLSFDKNRAVKLLPFVFPTVLTVFLVSLASSFLFSVFGASSSPIEDVGIVRMLIAHALIPAVLEELLFRYVPMKLLLPYSKRRCIIYSALCFALIHCSFLKMPYAFVAGAVFMTLDIIFGSVWPSVTIHLINNAISIVWMKYCSEPVPTAVFIAVLVLLAALSLLFIFKNKKEYKSALIQSFDKGQSFAVTYAPFMLVLICCYIAAMSL